MDIWTSLINLAISITYIDYSAGIFALYSSAPNIPVILVLTQIIQIWTFEESGYIEYFILDVIIMQ